VTQPIGVDDVETRLRRKMNDEELAFAEASIPALQEVIEGWLSRCYGVRHCVEHLEVIRGYLYPSYRPVVEVLSLADINGVPRSYQLIDDEMIASQAFSYPGSLVLTYLAGEPVIPPSLRMFVAGAVARTVMVPSIVQLGVLGSYTVEGMSIGYSPSMTDGSAGNPVSYTVGELIALEPLRRLQFT
jgi:hypothetical protein